MEKQDIRHYSDSELSLIVMNDEGLYRMRHDRGVLLEVIDELFIYNEEQKEELFSDLDEDESKE